MQVWKATRALEEAGAFGAEIEVVPADVTAEISRRTSLFMVSMGGGTGGDCQYLFGCDMLGYNTGHVPRHAKVYRDFAAEYARLQQERVDAFREFVDDVRSGAIRSRGTSSACDRAELGRFLADLEAAGY